MRIAARSLLATFCALVPLAAFARAQKPPTPPPELQKLGPMVGNWAGSGTMTEPSGTTKWTASGSYRWVLGGFWLQEDFALTFDGNPDPLVFRSYLGWDRERRTFVNASVNNGGAVQMHDFTLQPDGTMLQMMLQHGENSPYAERSLMKISGDTMTHSIDLLMGSGPSVQMLDGKFQRQDAEAPSALEAKGTWMGASPHESMQKLALMAGSYEATGESVAVRDKPALTFKGVYTFRPIFGGMALHVRNAVDVEGGPGRYECDAFWASNGRKKCFVALFVSNFGELGTMEARLTRDGKTIVTTMATTMNGQPVLARTVIALDDEGRPQTMTGHQMIGTSPPFENFRATCTKK